jgi:formyl-CoA transferase/CoA:oxalate CoA-transferase
MNASEWTADARFATPAARVEHREALTAALNQRLAGRDAHDWVALLTERGVPAGPINDMAEVFADAQVRAREMYVELPHPELGVFKTTGLPVKLSDTPGRIASVPPLVGADTDAVLEAVGLSAEQIEALRRDGIV